MILEKSRIRLFSYTERVQNYYKYTFHIISFEIKTVFAKSPDAALYAVSYSLPFSVFKRFCKFYHAARSES